MIKPLLDQSVFVRASINGVIREAVIAACLTALMILLFLGSWRSTLIIAVSIPLSILTSIIVLSALGETINIMTLGGLALAVGILVDDATVAIENINRISSQARSSSRRFSTARSRSRCPRSSRRCASASCSCRCSSSPASRAISSCRWPRPSCSRCSRPTCSRERSSRRWRSTCSRRTSTHGHGASRNPFVRVQRVLDAGFVRLRNGYRAALAGALDRRGVVVTVFLLFAAASFLLVPVGRPGFLSRGRQRPVQAARPRAHRDPHRGDGAALRPDRRGDPRHHPEEASSTASSTTSACRTAA